MLKIAFSSTVALLLGFCTLFHFNLAIASSAKTEKRYRVELVVFQNPTKTTQDATELGKPDLTKAVPFAPLPLNKLVLTMAKRKFSRQSSPLLHEGWVQTAGTKESPTQVHLIGGKELGDGVREVDGLVQIIPGKQMFVTTDLALFHNDTDTNTPTQVERLQTTIPVMYDELNYVNHRGYSMIIMVTPDITRRI